MHLECAKLVAHLQSFVAKSMFFRDNRKKAGDRLATEA
jgi:hypothetical protein